MTKHTLAPQHGEERSEEQRMVDLGEKISTRKNITIEQTHRNVQLNVTAMAWASDITIAASRALDRGFGCT